MKFLSRKLQYARYRKRVFAAAIGPIGLCSGTPSYFLPPSSSEDDDEVVESLFVVELAGAAADAVLNESAFVIDAATKSLLCFA